MIEKLLLFNNFFYQISEEWILLAKPLAYFLTYKKNLLTNQSCSLILKKMIMKIWVQYIWIGHSHVIDDVAVMASLLISMCLNIVHDEPSIGSKDYNTNSNQKHIPNQIANENHDSNDK